MKILSFGSCNIDCVYRVEHFVTPGETLKSSSFSKFPGGKGLNQTLAMARSGLEVYHAGCIGSDGMFLKELLSASGADTSLMRTVEGEPTGHAVIQLNESGQNCIIIYSGANACTDTEYIDRVLDGFSSGDILLLQNEIANLSYIIDKAYRRGMKIILNPSPFEPSLCEIDREKLYMLILNEVEALGFTGEGEPNRAIEAFKMANPRLKVVLTLGDRGSIYFDGENETACRIFKVKTVDTTAAGDTFTGYFINGLVKKLSAKDILKYASAAAAIAVSREGAAVSIPTYAEVTSALEKGF